MIDVLSSGKVNEADGAKGGRVSGRRTQEAEFFGNDRMGAAKNIDMKEQEDEEIPYK